VVIRHGGVETAFAKGDSIPMDNFRRAAGFRGNAMDASSEARDGMGSPPLPAEITFWDHVHRIEDFFQRSLDEHRTKEATNSLLDLDSLIWRAQTEIENPDFISQAREILRDFIVLLAIKLDRAPPNREVCLEPLVVELLKLRNRFRDAKKWEDADALRETLSRAGVLVEDTLEGARWQLR
jgi:cysteinyl-tRNA synthetase